MVDKILEFNCKKIKSRYELMHFLNKTINEYSKNNSQTKLVQYLIDNYKYTRYCTYNFISHCSLYEKLVDYPELFKRAPVNCFNDFVVGKDNEKTFVAYINAHFVSGINVEKMTDKELGFDFKSKDNRLLEKTSAEIAKRNLKDVMLKKIGNRDLNSFYYSRFKSYFTPEEIIDNYKYFVELSAEIIREDRMSGYLHQIKEIVISKYPECLSKISILLSMDEKIKYIKYLDYTDIPASYIDEKIAKEMILNSKADFNFLRENQDKPFWNEEMIVFFYKNDIGKFLNYFHLICLNGKKISEYPELMEKLYEIDRRIFPKICPSCRPDKICVEEIKYLEGI